MIIVFFNNVNYSMLKLYFIHIFSKNESEFLYKRVEKGNVRLI